MVRVVGLSADSRTARALMADRRHDRNVRRIDDPKAAEAYFAAIGG